MSGYDKPLPQPKHEDKEFWARAKKHELLLKRCGQCGNFYWYNNTMCPACLSPDIEWVKSSGKGKIWTYTITYHNPQPIWDSEAPYISVHVDLEEGTRYVARLFECKPEDVKIGMPVEVIFEDVTEEITLPQFRPART